MSHSLWQCFEYSRLLKNVLLKCSTSSNDATEQNGQFSVKLSSYNAAVSAWIYEEPSVGIVMVQQTTGLEMQILACHLDLYKREILIAVSTLNQVKSMLIIVNIQQTFTKKI